MILAIFVGIGAFGFYAWQQLAIEAYPDIADVTSQVVTQYPGHAAEEVEQQITIPLERELAGVPRIHVMRSESTFGLSLITVVFQDGVEDYWSRQRLTEAIGQVTLPAGIQAGLDPLTSPTGEIYRFTVESSFRSPRELKEIEEWIVKPRLKQVFGIADVTNFGGETTQFQVVLDPAKLTSYGLSLSQVITAVQNNNQNAGGSVLVHGEQGFVVRGIGSIQSRDDLGRVVVTSKNGTPVLVRDLGIVQLGAKERSGVLGKDGNDDAVSAIVTLLKHENPSRVLAGIHTAVDELNTRILPQDVKVIPYLDRTTLVDTTLETVLHTLLEGMGLVLFVLLLFLGSVRAALLVALTIPFAMLFAFILMHFTNVPANLLSLGAIDFGIIVDSAIVLMEVILRRRERSKEPMTEDDTREAIKEVAHPIFFAGLIVITAYLPLFAFERVERKLFTPMAFTIGYALLGALIFALMAIPPLAYLTYRKPVKTFNNPAFVWLRAKYDALLIRIVARPKLALWPGVGVAGLVIVLGLTVGREFLPYLDEGSIWLQVQLPPGISLSKGVAMAHELRQAVREFPEISYVVTQLGRNDDGTDPWTPSHIECSVGLKPYQQWGGDKQDLIRRLSERLKKISGIDVGFSQPMIDGVNDKIAGAHSELVVKVYGNDFAETRRIAQEIADLLPTIRGAADVAIDQEPPLPQLQIKVNREAAARYGLNVADVGQLIDVALGGTPIGNVFIADRVYDLGVRFTNSARNTSEAIANLPLVTPTGAHITLGEVADVKFGSGESTITREMGRRHLTVKLDLRDRDLASFLAEAESTIAAKVKFDPLKYQVKWGGQFENQERAQARLAMVMPAVLGLIFLILYAAFQLARHAALILLTVPLAMVGGFLALHLRGMTLNVSSAVGFIALFGVAVQNGVIMVANFNRLRSEEKDLREVVRRGARERLRPVLMTASVATLGLLPAALAHGIGSDVQRPLATVIVGGLISATLLTLLILPAAYCVMERRKGEAESPYKPKPLPPIVLS